MTTDDHAPATGHADQRKQADQTTDHGADQPADGHDWSTYDGPVWSATEAARRSTVSRSTLTRRLAAGTIPGATRDADGWRIPALGLALAGIAANTPPDAPAPDNRRDDQADHTPTDATDNGAASAQVAILTAQLAAERARREGAERLADERAARITDLQTALRALTPPPATTDSADEDQDDDRARSASSPDHGTPTAPPTPQTGAQTTTPTAAASPQPRRGLFARLRDALTGE